MFIRTYCLAATLAIAIASTAQTSEPARAALRDPQLDALVAEALQNAPETAAARATLDAAQSRIVPARTLGDPFLSTTYQNDGRSLSLGKEEGSFLGLMVSQGLPWPGKLRLAGAIAASEAREIEKGMLGRSALTLEARVRNAWYDLVLAREIDRVIEDRRNAATQIEASVRERYAAGLGVQQDVLRAQVELARLDEQKALQAAAITSRLAELNRLVGTAQDRALATPAGLPGETSLPTLGALIAAAAERNPELAAARQGIETGEIRAELAKKNFLPDFTVNAGSMYRAGLEMGPMWQVGVGVSLPVWIERRQQSQLREAQAILRARTAEADALARELELRTRDRVAQLEAALHIASLYRDKILPLDEVSLESAMASYQAGKVPFITVLDALDTLYSDRAIYAGRLAESAKWRVAIDEASLQTTAMGGSGMSASVRSPSQPAAAPSTSNPSSMTSMR